jgi:hypothetical protein
MSGFFRILFLGILVYLVMKVVRNLFVLPHSKTPRSPDRDASKEVKNASFDSEDVIDAKFKDVK